MSLLVLAVGLLLASGLLALSFSRFPGPSTAIGTAGAVIASGLGLWPSLHVLFGQPALAARLPWEEPSGEILLGIDPLSAFFLVPLFVLGALAAVYGREYLSSYRGRKWLGPPTFFLNVLIASMAVVLTARSAVLFLVGWEVMTLAAYLLVSFDDSDREVRRAGWVFLVASHFGVSLLFFLFLLLDRHGGGLSFAAFASGPAMGPALSAVLFVIAAIGFGVKAGFVPLHVWLPEAHAAAPSHVSALMSGVLIKLGLYGLLRTLTFLRPAPYWGPSLVVLGLCGGLLGISLALSQRDLKRVLAYSSIENVGLITIGFGVAYWGAARGMPRVAALGALGALLHVWNHVVMKGMLFFSAGSVLHGAGTKDLERLGGLLKRMPRTGLAMLAGAVAISGLPPLNGFVSEWLLYLGLIRGGIARGGAAGILGLLSVGLVAMIGGLTALCFVRLCGIALLGEARSDAARHAHESSGWMTGPMLLLACAAMLMSVLPGPIGAALGGVVGQLFGPEVAAEVAQVTASLTALGTTHFWIWIALLTFGLVLWRLTRNPAPEVGTWDCGYAAPSARMQYTARSFAELMERLLPPPLRARATLRRPRSYFPAEGEYSATSEDPLTRAVYEPLLSSTADRFARLRWLQQGLLHVYLLYILVIVVLALAWTSWGRG